VAKAAVSCARMTIGGGGVESSRIFYTYPAPPNGLHRRADGADPTTTNDINFSYGYVIITDPDGHPENLNFIGKDVIINNISEPGSVITNTSRSLPLMALPVATHTKQNHDQHLNASTPTSTVHLQSL